MKKNLKSVFGWIAGVALVCGLVAFLWGRQASPQTEADVEREAPQARPSAARHPKPAPAKAAARSGEAVSSATAADGARPDEEAPETVEQDPEEKLVDAFDALTDTWQEPKPDKVTMDEVKRFREAFNKIPKTRKSECLHRALNLVPDENVMLLAGILFDKTQAKEILEDVYNDILNRDEDVKKPILEHIYKDREHPCWADTAWILDVTGELPNKQKRGDEKK